MMRVSWLGFVVGFCGAQFLTDACNYLYILQNKKQQRWVSGIGNTKGCVGCPGSVFVNNTGKIYKISSHNHPPSITEVQVMIKKQAILETVVATPQITTDTAVTNLLKQCINPEERALVVLKKSFERQIQRKKASLLQRPPKPREFNDLDVLPDTHSLTADGERFLLCNFVNNGKMNLVFSSREELNLLRIALLHQGDGTFDYHQILSSNCTYFLPF